MTQLSPNPHYAPKSNKAGLWHGPTSADLGSAHGSLAPEGWGTRVDHPSSPGRRIGTDRKGPNGHPQIPGSLACTPRVTLPGQGDSVADHGISSGPARKAFGDLLVPPGIEVGVHTPGPLLALVT